ncbi:MAG: ectonucleotide pyrophosphatase/phosphodiesterase [Rhizomicrobium sp.]
MKRFLIALTAFVLVAASASGTPAGRTVVVVMFDGLSPAELDAARPTPNFDRLRREGAWSRHLVPAFPTLSLINHTTFLTGCWPAHHGVVSNTFRDPELGWFAAGSDRDDAVWRTGCETIWEAAERQGVHAAAFNFVDRWRGSHPLAATVNPEVAWKDHEDDETILRRTQAALAHGTRLIALYFDFPDSVAHGDGVTGAKTGQAVRRADAVVGRLLAMLKGRPATLVVGTDHGMTDATAVINVSRLMNEYDIHAQAAVDGASTFLYLDNGESAARVAKALGGYGYAFDVYRTGHYPAYAHIGSGPRVGDLMLVAKPPYRMVDARGLPWWANWLGVNRFWSPIFSPGFGVVPATHGYPPSVPEMHGVFYVWGAGVVPGEIRRLDQVDVHPTVMKLLGLQPGRPMDGHAIAAVRSPAG